MTSQKLINASGKILIDRNIEVVFDFFSNPRNDRFWRTEINKCSLDGPLQSGVTVSEYSNLSRKASNNLLELKCIQFEKNNTAVFETTADSRFYLKSQRTVRSVSEELTEIMYKIDFDKSIVKFAIGFSLPDFIVRLKAGKDVRKYLQQLKKRLESH